MSVTQGANGRAEYVAEAVDPARIVRGDVIYDPAGARWMTVGAVRMVTAADGGVFSFYGAGPHDRVTFEGSERVRRRT